MTTKPCISITMFGEFSIAYKDRLLGGTQKHSKKCLCLLQYLIANRFHPVTQNDLIELLWPDDTSDNPVGALKTLLHRVRNLLLTLDLPKELILQNRGSYRWNNDLTCLVDSEEFERLYKETLLITDKNRLKEKYQSAISLYNGYFLSDTQYEPWVIPLNTYYHSLYLKSINEYIQLLSEEEDYNAISRLCCTALSIDNYDEDLHYHYIDSLYKLGKKTSAIEQYQRTNHLLMKKYNIEPSERFQSLYTKLISQTKTPETNLLKIRNQLLPKSKETHAYQCDYVYFKELFLLEHRRSIKAPSPLYLGLVTISNKYSGTLTPTTIEKSMTHLSLCMLHSLRVYDIFSKYSNNQYIFLLPSTTEKERKQLTTDISKKYAESSASILTKLEFHLLAV